MLQSAADEYDQQQRLTALAVLEAGRVAARGSTFVARVIAIYQAAAIALSMEWLPKILGEQNITPVAEAAVVPMALLTDERTVVDMLDLTDTQAEFDRLVATITADAARTARAVETFVEPAVTGYIRSLRPPSCSRCVVLAGRVYSKSEGFLRHPLCDCLMTPTDQTVGPTLVTDPREAFENGWIGSKDAQGNFRPGLSRADIADVRSGKNLNRVLNRRRSGLSIGSSVDSRRKATPQDLMTGVTDQIAAFAALREAGFITT